MHVFHLCVLVCVYTYMYVCVHGCMHAFSNMVCCSENVQYFLKEKHREQYYY